MLLIVIKALVGRARIVELHNDGRVISIHKNKDKSTAAVDDNDGSGEKAEDMEV